MRRNVPLTIALVGGLLMISTSFIPDMQGMYDLVLLWFPTIVGFTFFLGIISFAMHHSIKIRRKVEGWGYSVAAIGAFVLMVGAGIYGRVFLGRDILFMGSPEESMFQWMFYHMLVPMEATMFALLAFYIASASFRAFRARNIEATLLLIAGILIMVGKVPLSELVWEGFGSVQEWIQEFPNTAAKRAIMIGVGLGMASTALKLILGVERSYLGRGE
jgi:hypothetical protein